MHTCIGGGYFFDESNTLNFYDVNKKRNYGGVVSSYGAQSAGVSCYMNTANTDPQSSMRLVFDQANLIEWYVLYVHVYVYVYV